MVITGRDVYHKEFVSSAADLAGLGFLIAKATQGLQHVDEKYVGQVALAHDNGLVAGSFHFLEVGDGAAQCDRFLEVVRPVAGPDHLYAVDVEPYQTPDHPPRDLHPNPEDLVGFHRRFHELMPGRVLLVYSFPAFWAEEFKGLELNCLDCRLWNSVIQPDCPVLGQVTKKDAIPLVYGGFPTVTIHQFQTSPVDTNHFFGTQDDLLALARPADVIPAHNDKGQVDEMIQVIQNATTNEARFLQLTDKGLKVFAPMSAADLRLVKVLVAGGGARVVTISDDHAWQTALSHQ